MFAYLVHYVFIAIWCKIIIANTEVGEIATVIILFVCAEVSVFVAYLLMEKCLGACKKKDDGKKVENQS